MAGKKLPAFGKKMKTIKFQDLSQKTIQISFSGGGDYRIYYDVDNEDSPCLLMNKYQALILINALRDLIYFNEN